jgi:hypothetical protein
MIHIGECTQLPAQYELDQCSAVEVLSSSSRHKKHCADCRSTSLFKIHSEHCRFVEVLLTSRSTTNTADLPKFFSPKIYIKHCRFVEVLLFKIHNKHCKFVEVLLSLRSTTNTVDLSKFFSLQDPQQTL